jgi:predicted Zn finger-like uncharacterized protein
MRLTCSKCDTKFIIIPEQLGIFGRKVKCSKCMYIWHQSVPNAYDEVDDNNNYLLNQYLDITIPEKHNNNILPIISNFRKNQYNYIKLFLYFIIISIILSFSFFYYLRFNNNKMIIRDIKSVPLNDSNTIKIHYKIINSSNEAVQMPLIRIRLFDNSNNIIKYYISDRLNIMLQPKQHINMKTELTAPIKNINHTEITLGNRIDFLFK